MFPMPEQMDPETSFAFALSATMGACSHSVLNPLVYKQVTDHLEGLVAGARFGCVLVWIDIFELLALVQVFELVQSKGAMRVEVLFTEETLMILCVALVLAQAWCHRATLSTNDKAQRTFPCLQRGARIGSQLDSWVPSQR